MTTKQMIERLQLLDPTGETQIEVVVTDYSNRKEFVKTHYHAEDGISKSEVGLFLQVRVKGRLLPPTWSRG